MRFADLLFQILISIGAGFYLTLPLVRASQVGRRYFLYHGTPTLVLCGILVGFLRVPFYEMARLCWVIFFFAGYAYCYFAGYKPKIALVCYLASLFAILSAATSVMDPTSALYNFLGSMALLGLAQAAMWLGHWYLVQPKLSISELGRIVSLLITVVILRFLWGSYLVGSLLIGKSESEIYRYLMGTTAGIFVLMRYCWGLLLPLGLCYFIWKTARMRSTQAATGLLYIMVLSVLVGEILSQYLALAHGIYF